MGKHARTYLGTVEHMRSYKPAKDVLDDGGTPASEIKTALQPVGLWNAQHFVTRGCKDQRAEMHRWGQPAIAGVKRRGRTAAFSASMHPYSAPRSETVVITCT